MFRSQVVAVSVLTMHTVGEAAAAENWGAIAVDHRRSAAGAATPAELVEAVGDHASPARAAGPAAAVEADGAAVASVGAVASAVEASEAAAVSAVEERTRRSE